MLNLGEVAQKSEPRPDGVRRSQNFLSLRAQRTAIGVLGLALPCALLLVAAVFPTDPLPRARPLHSVSAYYYTSAVSVFTGVLVALAVFLFTYRGYEGPDWDRWVGRLGGAAAFTVALVPTEAPDASLTRPWWTATMSSVHYGAAVTLFACFAAFALYFFRKSHLPPAQQPRDKRLRNHFSLACGIAILVGMAWAGARGYHKQSIFVPEALAIVAFASSWLVKAWATERAARPREQAVT